MTETTLFCNVLGEVFLNEGTRVLKIKFVDRRASTICFDLKDFKVGSVSAYPQSLEKATLWLELYKFAIEYAQEEWLKVETEIPFAEGDGVKGVGGAAKNKIGTVAKPGEITSLIRWEGGVRAVNVPNKDVAKI